MDGLTTGTIKGKLGFAPATPASWPSTMCASIENRLGEEGEGFKIAMSCIDQGRFTVGAGACGLTRACLDASVKYANERHAFGEPISKFQLIQQMIAKMVAGYDASYLLTMKAAELKNRGIRNTRETSLMKWYGCDVALNLQTTRYKFTARMAIRMNIPLSDSGETPAVQLSMKEPGRFISWSRRAMLSDIAKTSLCEWLSRPHRDSKSTSWSGWSSHPISNAASSPSTLATPHSHGRCDDVQFRNSRRSTHSSRQDEWGARIEERR